MLRLRIDPNWSRPSDLNRGPADDESVSTLNPAGVGCSRLKSQITKIVRIPGKSADLSYISTRACGFTAHHQTPARV